MIISIANQAQLTAALSKAVGGETFSLAPGSYGAISLRGRDFTAPITIQSATASNMAKLSGIQITDSSNIALKALDVGRAMTAKEKDLGRMIAVIDAENVSLDGMKVHGTLDGNPGNDGWGMYVTESRNIRVTNSEFTELKRGMVFQRSSQLVVEDNHLHHLRSDGTNFSAVDTVLIKDNRYSDFFMKGGDHPDAIQIWTAGQKRGSSNITITGNQIFQGAGSGLQGIFLRDEVGTMPFKNVRIDNNILYGNDMWQGIAVLHGSDVAITNNTVVSRNDDKEHFWIKVENVSGVAVERNVADQVIVSTGVTSARIADNLEIRGDSAASARVPNLNKGAGAVIGDLLVPGIGYRAEGGSDQPPPPPPPPSPSPSPTPAPAPAPPPPATGSNVFGTAGSETVNGSAGSDIIYGVGMREQTPGRRSSDKLYGRGGADTFVLGDERGAFYEDDRNWHSGRADFAQILDFSSNDRVRLSGVASDYVFRRETVNSRVGTAILKDTNGNRVWDGADELIGHVAGVTLTSKSVMFSGLTGAQTSAGEEFQPPHDGANLSSTAFPMTDYFGFG